MHPLLAADQEQLPALLHQTLAAAAEYLTTLPARPAATDLGPREYRPLPEVGLGAREALRQFLEQYGALMPASNGPRFWGFVTGGATPAALMGDWLTSAYDLNLSSAANSPAPHIEFEALHLLRELFGLPAAFHGLFVTGATMSNFAGLALAREWAARQAGRQAAHDGLWALPPLTVLSGAPHSSVYKALAMLGIGRGRLRPVALQPGNREAVEVAALEAALQAAAERGEAAIVVGNAGTVNTVDFDDLEAIAALKTRYPFWLHIDAAFGGFAVCAPRYQRLLAGWEAADSLTIDAHKWLNVPYDSAMLFTRHRDLQLAVFQNSGAYLGALAEPPDFVHLGPENSRRMRALPAWFGLLAYGRAGYRDIVERNCALAAQLGALIEASTAYRLLAPVRLNVVCFTLTGEASPAAVHRVVDRLRADGRVFLTPTVYQGTPGLRAAFSNWRTEAVDLAQAWEALCAVA